jgi:G:T/U-mismatch repair DNA glycosylase
MDDSVEVHTLILGTQPSDVSLEGNRYYDTHTNALWHIVGDALGWRRGWLDSKGRGPAPSITRSLLHEETVESYDEALRRLTSRGYALWDVLKQSERAGSLDGDIKNAQPADVRALVERHPSISRICFASGGTTAGFFKRHFKEWLLEEGAFRLADDPTTRGFAWPKARPRKAAVVGRHPSAKGGRARCAWRRPGHRGWERVRSLAAFRQRRRQRGGDARRRPHRRCFPAELATLC